MSADHSAGAQRPRGFIRGPQTFAAGIVMLALAALALWALGSLSVGTLRSMGPAMMPRSLAYLVGGFGVALAVIGLVRHGDPIERFSLRGPLFVVAGIVAFALTIRTVGLAVAGPLCLVIGGLATPDSKLRELLLFAVIVTAVCIVLFRYVLNLAMPILVIPGVVRI